MVDDYLDYKYDFVYLHIFLKKAEDDEIKPKIEYAGIS